MDYPLEKKDTLYLNKLQKLGMSVYEDTALNNLFYETWKTRKLSITEFKSFAINYFYRINNTVTRMSHAMISFDDPICRMQILHNIDDELGHGSTQKVHSTLAYRWLSQTLKLLGEDKELRYYLTESNLNIETRKFIDKTNLMCSKNALTAAGALLAQEWHGYTQIGLLLDGFKHYQDLFEFDERHTVSEYFYVHLGSAEKEHIEQMGIITTRYCQSEEDFKVIEDSFNEYLKLLTEFWNAISKEFKS